MTKQNIIDALASKYTKVSSDTEWLLVRTLVGVDIINILVWERVGDAMWENNILVCREGTDYYWKNGEPKVNGFNNRVLTFMNAKIADGTVKYAKVTDSNDSNKKATISAIMPDKTTKTVLLTETTLNNFTLEVIA